MMVTDDTKELIQRYYPSAWGELMAMVPSGGIPDPKDRALADALAETWIQLDDSFISEEEAAAKMVDQISAALGYLPQGARRREMDRERETP